MNLHIALCGPATINALGPAISTQAHKHSGYPFPLIPALAHHYVQQGHRVTVVSTTPDVEEVVEYEAGRLRLMLAPTRPRARDRALDMFRVERAGIAAALERARPDICHAHWTYEFALASHEARIAPVLTTAHDAPVTVLRHYRDPYRVARLLLALKARRRITHLTAVSPYLADRWRREMGWKRAIEVISNPLPPDLEISTDTNPRSDAPAYILAVGNSSRMKNFWTLVKAFAEVRRNRPDLELRLVGYGLGAIGPFASRVRSAGIDAGISFEGQKTRAELSKLYSQAAVFCHPSLEESQGVVLLEAMAYGLPIVAGQASGAVSWSLFDGRAALTVDVRNETALQHAIERALDDEDAIALRGSLLQKQLRARYGVETVASRYLALYQQILDAERPPI